MYPNAHDNKCLLNWKSQMNSQPFCYISYIMWIVNHLSNYAIKVPFCSTLYTSTQAGPSQVSRYPVPTMPSRTGTSRETVVGKMRGHGAPLPIVSTKPMALSKKCLYALL